MPRDKDTGAKETSTPGYWKLIVAGDPKDYLVAVNHPSPFSGSRVVGIYPPDLDPPTDGIIIWDWALELENGDFDFVNPSRVVCGCTGDN